MKRSVSWLILFVLASVLVSAAVLGVVSVFMFRATRRNLSEALRYE